MSVAIGASAAGARAFTATASQGLLFMMEAVYNAGGLGFPIVMTLANRAVGAPINIWNDHSDAMAVRDAGWVQLFAETVQEAADLHIQAFRLAEEVSVPVMVCMDGFILTHATERVDLPTQEQVDAFLPPYEPRQVLDPADPYSIGAMVGPEAFEEVRYLAHARQLDCAGPHQRARRGVRRGLRARLGRIWCTRTAAPMPTWWSWRMGSVLGTIKDVIDMQRAAGHRIGALGITSFRPFPIDAVRNALKGARRVVVVEKAISVGFGGVLSTDVAMTLSGLPVSVATVVAGLGGRSITKTSLGGVFEAALADELGRLTFLDLNQGLVERELERMALHRRSGPTAENMLRDLGVAASRIG